MTSEKVSDLPPKAAADERGTDVDTEAATIPRGRAAWFGGPGVKIGPRIAPVVAPLGVDVGSESDLSSNEILLKQRESEENCAIQYRTCSWQKVGPQLTSLTRGLSPRCRQGVSEHTLTRPTNRLLRYYSLSISAWLESPFIPSSDLSRSTTKAKLNNARPS